MKMMPWFWSYSAARLRFSEFSDPEIRLISISRREKIRRKRRCERREMRTKCNLDQRILYGPHLIWRKDKVSGMRKRTGTAAAAVCPR